MSETDPTRGTIARRVIQAALTVSVYTSSAWAGHGSLLPTPAPEPYRRECASCHVPYPPGMLPAQSWQRILSTLDQHYGSDASLDDKSRLEISTWLIRHSGTYKRVGSQAPAEDRISRSAWFQRKHRKVNVMSWALPSVKSAANCGACHINADRGLFDDHD